MESKELNDGFSRLAVLIAAKKRLERREETPEQKRIREGIELPPSVEYMEFTTLEYRKSRGYTI